MILKRQNVDSLQPAEGDQMKSLARKLQVASLSFGDTDESSIYETLQNLLQNSVDPFLAPEDLQPDVKVITGLFLAS